MRDLQKMSPNFQYVPSADGIFKAQLHGKGSGTEMTGNGVKNKLFAEEIVS